MSFNSNTTGVTCGAGTANPDFTPVLRGVRVSFCQILCLHFILTGKILCVDYIVLSTTFKIPKGLSESANRKTDSRSDISCRLTVTRLVSHVEQELLTLTSPRFLGGFVLLDL
jgi:hypothetical protein